VENNWNAVLQTLEGHSDIVYVVAFWLDGALLASISHIETVGRAVWCAASSFFVVDPMSKVKVLVKNEEWITLCGTDALLLLESNQDLEPAIKCSHLENFYSPCLRLGSGTRY
jgi:hypothetical protein